MTAAAEYEVRMFWSISKDLRRARRKGRDTREFLDEIEAIALHTDQQHLRVRCMSILCGRDRLPERTIGTA